MDLEIFEANAISNSLVVAPTILFLAILAFRSPEWGLAGILALGRPLMNLYVDTERVPFRLFLGYVVGACLVARFFFFMLEGRVSNRFFRHPLLVMYVTYWLGMLFVSYMMGQQPGSSGISRIRHFMFYDLVPFMGFVCLSSYPFTIYRILKRAFVLLLPWQSLFFCIALAAMLSGYSPYQIRYMLVFGIEFHAAGNVLFMILCMCFALDATSDRWMRNAAIYGLVIGTLLIIAAQSRTAMYGAFLSVILILVQYQLSLARFFKVMASSVVLLGILAYGLSDIFPAIQDIVQDRLAKMSGSYNEVTSGRIDLWTQAIASFQSSPLVGVGMGNATDPIFYDSSIGVLDEGYRPGAHHFILETLAENGLFGLLLVCLFIFISARAIFPVGRRDLLAEKNQVSWVILKTAFIYSLIDISVGGPDYLFWSAMGAFVVLGQDRKLRQDFSRVAEVREPVAA